MSLTARILLSILECGSLLSLLPLWWLPAGWRPGFWTFGRLFCSVGGLRVGYLPAAYRRQQAALVRTGNK
jgi:hypothetical protein